MDGKNLKGDWFIRSVALTIVILKTFKNYC